MHQLRRANQQRSFYIAFLYILPLADDEAIINYPQDCGNGKMPTVVNKENRKIRCLEHPEASGGRKPLNLNLKANRQDEHSKLIYIAVLNRGHQSYV